MKAYPSARYLNRELSWLEFDARVFEEARDNDNPLGERLRFFSIFRSNLDEFFMVRVASLAHLVALGDNNPDPSGLTPNRQLEMVTTRVRALYQQSHALYSGDLVPALEGEGIGIGPPDCLDPARHAYLDAYFEKEIYPVLTPITIDREQPFPRLPGLAVHLAVLLDAERVPSEGLRLAVVQASGRIPGLIRIPNSRKLEMCWTLDVIRRGLPRLFPGWRILESAAFRLTRDSELELDDEGTFDFMGMLESELKKRKKAKPIRVEHAAMSARLLGRLRESLDIGDASLFSCGEPLDPRPLLELAESPVLEHLRHRRQIPVLPPEFEGDRGIFDILRGGDILLHHPYDSFEPVARFIQAAAEDPDVLAIKQTLYRTGGKSSPIVRSLIRAAEGGKQVTVLVELTARFDEQRNISWARELEEAGAHVLYGLAGLKVHAKIALVVRREPSGIRRYVHLGTGNYNEHTARTYTDLGLLTCREDFGSDASAFFNTITGYSEPPFFRHLVMAPNGLRDRILLLIRREADWARTGQSSEILAKMNALVDPEIIRELYAASSAGVRIHLNVRGICCLRPALPGVSDRIRVTSIVDRHLEHSRVFVFSNGGNPEAYLSSADWMPRNLDRRVELMFPVLQEDLKKKVIGALGIQLGDNCRAWELGPDGAYARVSPDGRPKVRTQEALYRISLEELRRSRSITPGRFTPIEGDR